MIYLRGHLALSIKSQMVFSSLLKYELRVGSLFADFWPRDSLGNKNE